MYPPTPRALVRGRMREGALPPQGGQDIGRSHSNAHKQELITHLTHECFKIRIHWPRITLVSLLQEELASTKPFGRSQRARTTRVLAQASWGPAGGAVHVKSCCCASFHLKACHVWISSAKSTKPRSPLAEIVIVLEYSRNRTQEDVIKQDRVEL